MPALSRLGLRGKAHTFECARPSPDLGDGGDHPARQQARRFRRFLAAYLMATHSNGIAALANQLRFLSAPGARRQAQSHGRSRARPVGRGRRDRAGVAPRMIPWPAAPGAATTASCSSSAPSRAATATRRAACAWRRDRGRRKPRFSSATTRRRQHRQDRRLGRLRRGPRHPRACHGRPPNVVLPTAIRCSGLGARRRSRAARQAPAKLSRRVRVPLQPAPDTITPPSARCSASPCAPSPSPTTCWSGRKLVHKRFS